MKLDITQIKNLVVDQVDTRDYPDFVDAYIMYAEHANGQPLSDLELDYLNDDYPEVAQQEALESLY